MIKMKVEEEKDSPHFNDNLINANKGAYLNDIKEETEEQCFDRSSSLNSNTVKRFWSTDEFKISSESPKNSNQGESGNLSSPDNMSSFVVKTGKVDKKGMFFFNERTLTLTSSPRLSYISHGSERTIDLNPTTMVKQLPNSKFEITNYYPTTKYTFKAESELECEEWVLMLKKYL